MSVRKRIWKTSKGETREAWVVSYNSPDKDGKLKARIETFALKKDADARHAQIKVDVSKGVHTPLNRSITVAKAAADWLSYVELEGCERATLANYSHTVDHHIVPRIGAEKLAKLTTPGINAFRDALVRDLSRTQAKKVLGSLKSIIKDAKRRGNVAQNVASDVTISANKRDEVGLQVGIDIPEPAEVTKILAAATGRQRPFLVTAVFTGLRSSELRGLRWVDVDLAKGEINVRQRADRYNVIGKPKSRKGTRTIPIGPFVVNALKEWKLRCPGRDTGKKDAEGNPVRELHLVFPTGNGNIESRGNMIKWLLWPVQVAAGVTVTKLAEDGSPVTKAKYTGLHALRHFYASWCINRKVDGGLDLPPKVVQERLGHAKHRDDARHLRAPVQAWRRRQGARGGGAAAHRVTGATRTRHAGGFANENNVTVHFHRMRFQAENPPLAPELMD
jgi:integrase